MGFLLSFLPIKLEDLNSMQTTMVVIYQVSIVSSSINKNADNGAVKRGYFSSVTSTLTTRRSANLVKS